LVDNCPTVYEAGAGVSHTSHHMIKASPKILRFEWTTRSRRCYLTAETAAVLVSGASVGKHSFGVDEYPVPCFDKKFVDQYLGRMRAIGP
jgi:hypothetical protein